MTLIEMLRANGSWEADAAVTAIQVRDRRIEKLEAALRKYADEEYNGYNADGGHARRALEGKDE
jgi:ribonuclease HII